MHRALVVSAVPIPSVAGQAPVQVQGELGSVVQQRDRVPEDLGLAVVWEGQAPV